MNSKIRTVLGDIPPEKLGVTYMHEHLIIESEIVKNNFDYIYLPSVEEAISEVLLCKKVGVQSMVDCMPTGAGRNAQKLKKISAETGINIVATTGLHHDRYYNQDDEIEKLNSEQLAQLFINEIENGMDNTDVKAGIIKVSTSGPKIKDREFKLFEAAAIAINETGAPIISHCEHGTGALEQINLLNRLGINLSRVTLSHTDKENDHGYHQEILSSGINVEYDQSLRQGAEVNPQSAQLTVAMINAGFVSQIMLGTDGARRSLWSSLGGTPGLSWLYSGWSKKLEDLGVSQEQLNKLFISNPASMLTFSS
jgi:phosphotriesterase-related protein